GCQCTLVTRATLEFVIDQSVSGILRRGIARSGRVEQIGNFSRANHPTPAVSVCVQHTSLPSGGRASGGFPNSDSAEPPGFVRKCRTYCRHPKESAMRNLNTVFRRQRNLV